MFDAYSEDAIADMEELRAEARWEKARQRRLWANPDCQDPDHPGCDKCEEEETTTEEEEEECHE